MNWFETLFGSFGDPRNAINAPMVKDMYGVNNKKLVVVGDFHVGDEGWFCDIPRYDTGYDIIKMFHCKLIDQDSNKFTAHFTHYNGNVGCPVYIYVNKSDVLDISANYKDFYFTSMSYGTDKNGHTRFCYMYANIDGKESPYDVIELPHYKNDNVNIFDDAMFNDDLIAIRAAASFANKDELEFKRLMVNHELV